MVSPITEHVDAIRASLDSSFLHSVLSVTTPRLTINEGTLTGTCHAPYCDQNVEARGDP